MANPYYYTYNFREERLASGDLARLKVKFQVNTDGTDQSVNAKDEEVYVSNYGSLEWDYDFENFLLVPGYLDLRLAVPKETNFEKFFFGQTLLFFIIEKTPEVTLEIKYQGTTNWETEFKGFVIEDTIDYDPDKGYMWFTIAPRTDILNRQMLYDLNGNPTNPFTYPTPTSNQTYLHQTQKIITDCYKLVNPSVQMVFSHPWLFFGQLTDRTVHPAGWILDLFGIYNSYETYYNDFNFSEIWQDVRPLFFDQSKGLRTVGDLLRKLAMDWFAITGMLHQDKAFFKKLFYDPSTTYELSEDTYYNTRKRYKLPFIRYVRYKIPTGVVYEQGVFTELEGQYIDRDSLIGWYDTFTNIMAVRNSEVFNIKKGRDPDLIGSNQDYGNLITPLWYLYRGDILNCRVDPIVTPGINHSILANPRFQNRTYQPIRLKKLFMEGKTEIDGLLIGY